MSPVSMGNDEKPYQNLEELLSDYGYRSDDIGKASKELEFVGSIIRLSEELERDFVNPTEAGRVYSIQAPWGMGKTSYLNILINMILSSPNINTQLLCYYYYDSLYYGDVSEAITTLLQQLFQRVERQFVIKLRGVQDIARNLAPSLEVNGLLAKIKVTHRTSDTNSIISENIKSQLKHIKGKIFVVIDDIDRLTGSEALHLLRMIRLLQGLPNTYIFLPIDYDALIKMLDGEHVANPGGYVRKIITKPIRLPLGFNDSRVFFQKNCIAELGLSDSDLTREHLKDLWMGYLWELSLDCLHRLEIGQPSVRLPMNTPASNSAWEQAERLNGANQNNFILDFFQKTRRQYGSGDDYLVKFKVVGSDPELYRFYRYSFIAPETTFDRFFNGSYNEKYMITQVGGGLEMVGGNDVFGMMLFKESDVLATTGKTAEIEESSFYEATKEQAEQLEDKKVLLWDLILREIPDVNLPNEILRHVSPRMIKRLIDELSREKGEKIKACVKKARSTGNNLYLLAKETISEFVEEYATE